MPGKSKTNKYTPDQMNFIILTQNEMDEYSEKLPNVSRDFWKDMLYIARQDSIKWNKEEVYKKMMIEDLNFPIYEFNEFFYKIEKILSSAKSKKVSSLDIFTSKF
jgi:hypothetical protein